MIWILGLVTFIVGMVFVIQSTRHYNRATNEYAMHHFEAGDENFRRGEEYGKYRWLTFVGLGIMFVGAFLPL